MAVEVIGRPRRARPGRDLWSVLAAAGTATLLGGLLVGGAVAAAAARTADPFPDGLVHLEGHGWGPGLGMGQWGAFGYAVQGETYQWILSHFYGGTTLATGKDPTISVVISANDGDAVTVTSPSHFRFGGLGVPAGEAARAVLDTSTGTWRISTAASCTAKSWTVQRSGLEQPRAVPSSQKPTAPATDLLTLCEAGGVRETVRGLVEAYDYDDANTGNVPLERTLNLLPLDEYVADVVPSESSTGWGEVGPTGAQGEPEGFQELEAQAVAARTYVLAYMAAGGWYGYADICDIDWCQSYPGIENESALATLAVTDTAGQYLELGGEPAPVEYSASTGGYTAPSAFPAVVDAGDAVCLKGTGLWTCNTEHTWTVTVPVTAVEAAFPTIGALRSVTVTARNGDGSWGGRVVTIEIKGSTGSVSESGDDFQSQFGLDSDWFTVTHPGTSTSTTSTTTGGSTSTTAGGSTSTTTSSSTTTTSTVAKSHAAGESAPAAPGHGGTGPLPGQPGGPPGGRTTYGR